MSFYVRPFKVILFRGNVVPIQNEMQECLIPHVKNYNHRRRSYTAKDYQPWKGPFMPGPGGASLRSFRQKQNLRQYTSCSMIIITEWANNRPKSNSWDIIIIIWRRGKGMEEEKDESRMQFRCIHCGCKIKLLFIQYSPGNIRLMKCGNCKVVADEYIECEIMILLIDLVMHKTKAYRHLLYNAPTLHPVDFKGILWKSAILYLLLDGYRNFLLKEDPSLSLNSISSSLICGKMLIDVLLVTFVFFCVLFLVATRILLTASAEATRYIDVSHAIFVSSYMRNFSRSHDVVTESRMSRCILVCCGAHAVKFLANLMIN
ncbi:hypothetical protein MKX01_007452 [Papaver californicum]|nr:hypothetical protein MKX01_007452 [Papaver californicum]